MLFFFAWPSRESLPYALVLRHAAYGLQHYSWPAATAMVISAWYYPVARGTAPLITLLATWLRGQRADQYHNRHRNRHIGVRHMARCRRPVKNPQS
jgi:hypothetical protein